MNEHKSETAAVRRWTIEIGRLRERAAKATRQRPGRGEETTELIESCLSVCQALVQEFAAAELRAQQAEREAEANETAWRALIERVPAACLEVDAEGIIVSANVAAGTLLNTSEKRLKGRPLLYFFDDRSAASRLLQAGAFDSSSPVVSLTLRPRERAPMQVAATVVGATDNAPVCWCFLMPGDVVFRVARPTQKLEQSA